MRRRATLLLVLSLLFTVPFHAAKRRSVGRGPVDESGLSTAEWLKKHAAPFDSTDPETGFDDLRALGTIVGDARVVSLGEATHGSREFFTMKHRVLEYLVENAGFTVFAIEASLPESDVVNDYVLHGTGDPSAAVKGMLFWTWNTDEMLAMVVWMRNYNLRRGDKPPVQFRGIDLQFSTHAMNELAAYLGRVDSANASSLTSLWKCWEPYALNSSLYVTQTPATRNACFASLSQLHDTIASRRTTYSTASSAAEFERMLRYARVIVQDESVAALRDNRDTFMAENTEWLLDVVHPGEKFVLWAHNYHVGTESIGTMGHHLRERFSNREMVIFGFAFSHGAFNAINGSLRSNRVDPWPRDYDEDFRGVGSPRFFLDLRDIRSTAAIDRFHIFGSTIWAIGAIYNDNPAAFRSRFALARTFDVIIWIEEVTASKLRP